jgi:FkbM family methyltransferase
MLNDKVGELRHVNGRKYIETAIGKMGHAVYGPYSDTDPGDYVVEFIISAPIEKKMRGSEVVAKIDVCGGYGTRVYSKKSITASDLRDGTSRFHLQFSLDDRDTIEYRIATLGKISFQANETRRVHRLEPGADVKAILDADQFPTTDGAPAIFSENEAFFRELYDLGLGVSIENGSVVLSKDGVRFHARCRDDTNFISEIFFERAYNISMDRDVCVIDIGMNIGLASMQFASRPRVKEVHAFEPFGSTYERAQANLALNPALAAKISAHNIGLGDRDALETFKIRDTQDSGARSTRNDDAGEIEVQLQMRAAGAVLEPIIAKAEALGRVVLAKIDCEGAEYAVFESLEAAGLLERISIFVMEWHPVIPGKSLPDLLEPLRARGFVIIDRSPLVGQGVFYAVRLPV